MKKDKKVSFHLEQNIFFLVLEILSSFQPIFAQGLRTGQLVDNANIRDEWPAWKHSNKMSFYRLRKHNLKQGLDSRQPLKLKARLSWIFVRKVSETGLKLCGTARFKLLVKIVPTYLLIHSYNQTPTLKKCTISLSTICARLTLLPFTNYIKLNALKWPYNPLGYCQTSMLRSYLNSP